MKINEVNCKTIINSSRLPGSEFVINPYVGCSHACVYCYARFMKKFTEHTEPWGKFVDVKINAPALIKENNKYKNKEITLSSVTDPYQPLEKKYLITRKILKSLLALQPHLCILTKSALITRDIDIIRQMTNCKAGFSFSTLDPSLCRETEPFASSPENRIEALKELKKAGIKSFVFISPILPELTDWKAIIRSTQKYADEIWFENLNVKMSNWHQIEKWLKQKHPQLVEKYKGIYFSKSNYWSGYERKIKRFCEENKIKHRIYFHHQSHK